MLGPLFIGSGERLEKSEYVMDMQEKRIYVMDNIKMFEGLNRCKLLDKFEAEVMDSRYKVDLTRFIRNNNIPHAEYKQWAKYSYPADIDTNQKGTQIMAFIKDPYNMPYVPGSSLKGAIRNCMLNAVLINSGEKEGIISELASISQYESRELRNCLNKKSRELDVLFHSAKRTDNVSNAVNSIFQGLRISDSLPLPTDCLTLCSKLDTPVNGNAKQLPIHRECIAPGTVIEFDVTIDKKYFPYDEKDLYKFINIMYNNEKECFLSHFPDVQSAQGNVLYLGGGTGFVSKTAVYSLTDNRIKAVDAARKILENQFRGKHGKDLTVSPHMRKCTRYKMKTYDFGLCSIDFQPMA